jgi:hypothetical protein
LSRTQNVNKRADWLTLFALVTAKAKNNYIVESKNSLLHIGKTMQKAYSYWKNNAEGICCVN